MSLGFNKVMLVGHLGSDVDLRHTADGQSYARVNLATTETSGKSEARKEYTEWHRLRFWGRQAEIADQYLRKGSRVFVEGSLRTNKWEKDGQTQYETQVIVRHFIILDSRERGQSDGDSAPRSQREPQSSPEPEAVGQKGGGQGGERPFENLDEDIPF